MSASPIQPVIETALASQGVPKELATRLFGAAGEMNDHYFAGRTRPSELSGSDFVEAAARVLQHLATGNHTPLGRPLPRFDQLLAAMEQSRLDDSLRIHVPRLLQVMYDVRNRRGVGHLPGPVSANRPDAELLLTGAKWVLAEVIRLFHSTTHEEAQRLVNELATPRMPLVQDFEGTLRLMTRRRASLPEELLVLLRASPRSTATRQELQRWARASSSQFSTALTRLDQRNQVHRYADGRITLTSLGHIEAEAIVGRLSA